MAQVSSFRLHTLLQSPRQKHAGYAAQVAAFKRAVEGSGGGVGGGWAGFQTL